MPNPAQHPYCAHVSANLSLPKPPAVILPHDLGSALQDPLAYLQQHIEALNVGHPLRKTFESVSKRIKLTEDGTLGPQALYQLPLALAQLESRIKHGEADVRAKLSDNCRNLIEKTLSHIVSAAARRLPKGEQWQADACELIGQGARYWAIRHSNSDLIALVAKTSEPDAFERLRHRWFMSRQLAAFDQPKILLVATTPFLHAFVKSAPGVSVSHLFTAAKGENKEQERAVLTRAAQNVGKLMRTVATLPIEGFSKLIPSKHPDQHDVRTTRIWRGEFDRSSKAFKIQERVFSNPAIHSDGVDEILARIGISRENFDQVAKGYQQTFKGEQKTCITHTDPHTGNFLYDDALQRVSILDWEDVAAWPEPVMLGRIFQFWSSCSKTGILGTSLFDEMMKGYAPDEQERARLREAAMKAAAVQYLTHVYLSARGDSHLTEAVLAEAPPSSVEKQSLAKLKAILKLLSGSPSN